MKTAVITGASAGIGKATAELFSKNGYKVYCLSRRACPVVGVTSLAADVTDAETLKTAFSQIFEECGRIDALVCNAGMGISGAVEDTTAEQAEKIFSVNFFGTLNTIQAAVPYLRKQGFGTIVTVSSAAAKFSLPFQAFYSATKSAVSSLAEALRLELAPFGVKVTQVLPGDVKTEFTAKREKNPSDNPVYGERIALSVARMEKDEQNGMPPLTVAKQILKLVNKKNPPVYVVTGKSYALLVALTKILPSRLASFALGKLYG